MERVKYIVTIKQEYIKKESIYHLTDINGHMAVSSSPLLGEKLFLYNQLELAIQTLIKFRNSEHDHVD